MSLHARILTEIEERILSGEWPPGTRIPFEHELTAQYQCSRMTVSKVLTQLANAGLIERRRKAGSFVKRPHSQSAVLDIHDLEAEVLALGLPYRHEITLCRKRRSMRAEQERLGLASPGEVLHIVCRHFAGPRPFCLERRLINLAAVPEAAEESFTTVPPGAWLIERVPWSAAEHKIRATAADDDVAAALSIADGSACLTIERRTWNADNPITIVTLTYPGNEHELVARFTPSQG
ncbi:histidine utilization repressor [Lichenihabitans sp. PAMC28606]|uniref:histidine utilization repressor n=1 Tax=Lichenihabitans sp. PAMC28606 TaxID=2880932 RepID=UPI001D0A498C|nr:histidine utilization repressor [Lichenihabitans sp. PAMC28606]UDL94122.1 histidine utilization repressor [Lichenihabitans sp. PAMC28606]